MIIAPSILSADFLHLEEEIKRAESAGADMIHCDVMDGMYVPNISFGFDIIKSVGSISSLPLDVHMMTMTPEKYLKKLASCGAAYVTVHHDNNIHRPETTLRSIRDLGMKAGLAISPSVMPETVEPYLELVDMVLVMSVEPGFGGQSFNPSAISKIRWIKKMIREKGYDVLIEVDGGINETTSKLVKNAGADIVVVGSAAFGSPDMEATFRKIR